MIREARRIPIHSIRPHPRNYRRHPEMQIAHLMESLRAHGMAKNIVASSDGYILAGHAVWEAARRLGFEEISVVFLDVSHDDPSALRFLIADNEIASLAISEDPVLADLLRDVESTIGHLLGTGWEPEMRDALFSTPAGGLEQEKSVQKTEAFVVEIRFRKLGDLLAFLASLNREFRQDRRNPRRITIEWREEDDDPGDADGSALAPERAGTELQGLTDFG